jgi:hypothetical protein
MESALRPNKLWQVLEMGTENKKLVISFLVHYRIEPNCHNDNLGFFRLSNCCKLLQKKWTMDAENKETENTKAEEPS